MSSDSPGVDRALLPHRWLLGAHDMPVRPRHLGPHHPFGDDISGWCGCAECDPSPTCGCATCREVLE